MIMSLLYIGAFNQSTFGGGTGRIWLDNVQCTGNERTLMDCTASSGSSGVNSCTHDQDAGVKCLLGKYNYDFISASF